MDELPSIALGIATLLQGRRNAGTHVSGGTSGPAPKSFLVTLIEIGARWWEQSGGTMKDEADLMKTLHGDTSAKHTKLEPDESRKMAALIEAMEPRERIVFRLALFLIEPETTVVTSPAKKETGKDGKERIIKEATSTTERTGVDMRINTLKGIASLVDSDLGNVEEVTRILRGEGVLGSENKALRAFQGGVDKLQAGLCRLLEVSTIDEVTSELVLSKIDAWAKSNYAPVPMSLVGRGFNMLIIGNKEIPEAILQGDGIGNALLRMLGVQTKGSKRNV